MNFPDAGFWRNEISERIGLSRRGKGGNRGAFVMCLLGKLLRDARGGNLLDIKLIFKRFSGPLGF